MKSFTYLFNSGLYICSVIINIFFQQKSSNICTLEARKVVCHYLQNKIFKRRICYTNGSKQNLLKKFAFLTIKNGLFQKENDFPLYLVTLIAI